EPLAGLACQGPVGEVKSLVAPRERGQQLLKLGKRQTREGQKRPTIALKFRKSHHEAVVLLFLITSIPSPSTSRPRVRSYRRRHPDQTAVRPSRSTSSSYPRQQPC